MTAAEDSDTVVARLQRRERWLLALAAVRTQMLSQGTMEEALHTVADRSANLLDADLAAVLLADAAGNLTLRTAAGPLEEFTRHGEDLVVAGHPWAQSLSGTVGNFDARQLPEPPPDSALAPVWTRCSSVLVADIPAAGDRHGGMLLCLRRRGAPPFDAEGQPELVGMAEQASIAMDATDRAQQRRLAELMADRQRIARDLHDHVIQRLFAVGLGLQATTRKMAVDELRGRVLDAVDNIDEAIADLRAAIFDLRATDDTRRSLRRRIRAIVAAVDGVEPRVTVRIDGPIDTVVPADIAADAEAVVREGVSNAVKHASASAISVQVTAAERLVIVISDDGVGIPEDVTHSGLANMAERAAAHGGNFVSANAQPGTRLEWVVPL